MEGEELVGDYVNTKTLLGRGTFAVVYKGYHRTSRRAVAIKQIDSSRVKQKKVLQDREIEVMRSLRHDNIVELLDVIFIKDMCYMVFEFCAGGDFEKYLRKQPGKRLSEAKAKHWMSQLKNGLMFLDQQRILHRDLKPQNLLLSSDDESVAVLKLADFGFARFINNEYTMIETVCGTPLYMAPEILRMEKYAISADLWSVGCILYQCLVGRPPFQARTQVELLFKLEKEEAVVPPDIRAQLSGECYNLLMRLLTKNKELRIGWDDFFRHPWFGPGGAPASVLSPAVRKVVPSQSPPLEVVAGSAEGPVLPILAQGTSPINVRGVTTTAAATPTNATGGTSAPRSGGGVGPLGSSGLIGQQGGNNNNNNNVGPGNSFNAVGVNNNARNVVDSNELTAASIIEHHENQGRIQRIADCALAVLELADMKLDHSQPDEACVLYWKGLECLNNAIAILREEKQAPEALLERLRLKMRIYQDRAARIIRRRSPVGSFRSPSDLMLEFALKMGQDGGVSEILCDYSKAEKLYMNGAVILEQLLAFARNQTDLALLMDALQRFALRIKHVREKIMQENDV